MKDGYCYNSGGGDGFSFFCVSFLTCGAEKKKGGMGRKEEMSVAAKERKGSMGL